MQIQFFVDQYAEFMMLQFYYESLDEFVARADFQLCEMGTDGLYLALSKPTLEEVVNQDMVNAFHAVYYSWFSSKVCGAFISSRVVIRPQNCIVCRNIKLFDKNNT